MSCIRPRKAIQKQVLLSFHYKLLVMYTLCICVSIYLHRAARWHLWLMTSTFHPKAKK